MNDSIHCRTFLVLFALLYSFSAAGEDDFAPLFPFQPTHDAPQNITNVRTWGGSKESEAGSSGFIMASGDNFIDGEGNERRFLGTNICFTGCFPDKQDAERVAGELSRYGFNIVRLHYCHHKFPQNKIYPKTDSFIEPDQLDRFDYLLYQLKKNGIYTYFQLNIARKFGEQNGFENASQLPWYNNGIDNYDFRMLQLQKKFHYEILNHVNPYTGTAYKDEPAISMLELANENSVVFAWFTPKYKFHSLCEPYGSEFKFLWNRYLKGKYGDTQTLKQAWSASLKGDGSEFLPDGIFTDSYFGKLWSFQSDKTGIAAWKAVQATPKDKIKGSYYASIRVEEIGKNPKMLQFYRGGIKCEAMKPFTLHMKAKADKAAEMTVRLAQAHAPWQVAGLQQKIELTGKWKEYTLTFVTSIDDDNVRLSFTGLSRGTYDIADVSITRGIPFTFPGDQALEDESIALPGVKDWNSIGKRALDFTAFLYELEANYFSQMKSNVSRSVRARQMIAGTQLQYGLDLPQARMDYCDFHSYWCHPVFNGKSWDPACMTVKNSALVNGEALPGTNLMSIARGRILGKPFTISEYDHPNLNPYASEGNLMCAAMGAFQGWNAIMQFAWSHNDDFFRDVLSPRFDLCSATAKLVHLPACWSMFVRGDVTEADGSLVFARKQSVDNEIQMIANTRNTFSTVKEQNRMMSYLPLAVQTGKQIEELPSLFEENGRTVIRTVSDVPADIREQYDSRQVSSSTGEITWNWKEKGAGYFTVDVPRTKVFTGFVRGRSFEFEGMTLSPGKTRMDWLTLSLTLTRADSSEDTSNLPSGSYLLAVTGVCHNTGEKIVEVKNGYLSCGENYGGTEGHAPILCEGIPAGIAFKGKTGKVLCYALDPSGNRCAEVKITDEGQDAVVNIGPEYRTLWYELIIK